jgi:hypothetical protein
MKKGKLLVVGLIALLMAGGLVLAGCYNVGCPNGDDRCKYSPNASPPVYDTCSRDDCGVNKAASENYYSTNCACTSF